jgi:hypothetical protein
MNTSAIILAKKRNFKRNKLIFMNRIQQEPYLLPPIAERLKICVGLMVGLLLLTESKTTNMTYYASKLTMKTNRSFENLRKDFQNTAKQVSQQPSSSLFVY